ncbi:hypothetical protein H0O03_00595 [Candidatus Micrarchaeota archaeon]|nr:hypothetical protein [Candidatus Micrarchaeota archaeon]
MLSLKAMREVIERQGIHELYDLKVEQTNEGLAVTHMISTEVKGNVLKAAKAALPPEGQVERGEHPQTGQPVYLLQHVIKGGRLADLEKDILSDKQQYNGFMRLQNLITYLERRAKRENK